MTEFIKAVASLLWPLLVAFLVCLYHREIRSLLRGFRHGKIGGVEFEVAEEVQKVALKTIDAEVAAEGDEPPLQLGSSPIDAELPRYESEGSWRRDRMYVHAPEYGSDPSEVKSLFEPSLSSHPLNIDKQREEMLSRMQLLDLASKDKSLAVLRVFNEIENEVQSLVSTMGLLQFKAEFPSAFSGYVQMLHKKGYITAELRDLLQSFWSLRTKMLHGIAPLADSTYVSVLDTGSRLLGLLRALPRELNRVSLADIPFFSDPHCQNEVRDARGVILEVTHPDGKTKNYRIYPTTQKYQPGQTVSWEWNRSKQWGPSWYLDPLDENRLKSAWGASVEFAGRRLEAIEHY